MKLHSLLDLHGAYLVVRTNENVVLQRRCSRPVGKTGVRSDQTVVLAAIESAKAYPDPRRRVSYFDAEIAAPVYGLVAIVGKRLEMEASLCQILQIVSVALFEKMRILRALQGSDPEDEFRGAANRLILCGFFPDRSEGGLLTQVEARGYYQLQFQIGS